MKHLLTPGMALLLVAGCSSPSPEDAQAADQGISITAPAAALPANYESKSANDKLSVLWNQRILPTKYTTMPAWASVETSRLFKDVLSESFKRTADERPGTTNKTVHALGSVVEVELVPEPGSPYTGLYKGGVGVARMSLANDPSGGYVPGLALKILASGRPSGNLLVMFTVDGQGDNPDFFANTFTNHIPHPTTFAGKLVTVVFGFAESTIEPGHLGIAGFASYDRNGHDEASPLAPGQVFFVPAASVKAVPMKHSKDFDLREDLAAIPSGTTLYDVLASPSEGETPVKIARVLTTSEVIASKFGDNNLFFKHNDSP